jgi:hypothetical protein
VFFINDFWRPIVTDEVVVPGKEFEARLAEAESFLTRGLDSGKNMLFAASSPAEEATAAGFDVPAGSAAEFNALFASNIAPRLVTARQAIEKGVYTWPSLKCSACSVACWGVAVAIVGVGAAAAGSLTATSGVVVSLASLVGCSSAAALTFLQSIVPLIAKGVAAVVAAICLWTQTCTQADLG